METYTPQHMALLAHAFAHFGVSPVSLRVSLEQRIPRCIQQFRGGELAILSMALSKLGCTDISVMHALRDEVFFRATVGRAFGRRFSLSLLDLQQIALSLVKMGHSDPRLFAVLADCCKDQLRRVTSGAPRDGGPPPSLMLMAGNAGPGGPLRGGPTEGATGAQTIACLAHALAKAGVRDSALCGMLERQMLMSERHFSSLGLSLFAAAAVSLEINNAHVWQALQRQGALRASHMPLDNLVSLLGSVSKGPPSAVSEGFIRAATMRLRLHILSLPPCSLAAAMVSLQRMRWRDSLFLSRASRILQKRQKELPTRALCGSFGALAKLSVRDTGVYVHLGKEIYARIHRLGQEDAATVLYSLLLLQPHPQLRQQQQQQAIREEEEDGEQQQQDKQQQEQEDQEQQFDGLLVGLLHQLQQHRHQLTAGTLYRVQLACLSLRLSRPQFFLSLPSPIVSFLFQASSVSLAKGDTLSQSSLLHRSVSRGFSLACIPHQSEVQVGPLCVDLLLGPRICIEVQGPPHYYRNTAMLTSASCFKLSLLQAMGYKVGTVSFIEWEQLTTRERRIVFCAQIAQHLLQPPRGPPGGPLRAPHINAPPGVSRQLLQIEGGGPPRTQQGPHETADGAPDRAPSKGIKEKQQQQQQSTQSII